MAVWLLDLCVNLTLPPRKIPGNPKLVLVLITSSGFEPMTFWLVA
jgi:hypothetical protein